MESIKGVLSVQKNKSGFELDVEPDEGINEEVAKAVISGSYGLIELQERAFNLEDVFIRLTNKESKK